MRRFLFISIGLNVALAALLASGLYWRVQPRIAVVGDSRATEESDVPVAAPSADSAASPLAVSAVVATGPQSWRDLESSDFKEYIANLRSIGCPEETIADIISSEVTELFRARLGQLPAARRPEYKYWEGPGWRKWLKPKLDPATEKVRRDLAREQHELLKTLLGPAYAVHDLSTAAALRWEKDPFFAALSPDKRGLVLDIHLRYDIAIQELREHRGSFMDEDDHQELARLQREKAQALAGLLTPKELGEFELRFSETTESLRKTLLLAFDASEPEFRAIFAAQKEIRELSRGENAAKLQTVEATLKESLGEERYAEYKIATEWEYRLLVQLAKEQDLPKESARKIYDLRAQVATTVASIRSDQTLTVEQRQQKLAEIETDTERMVTETLGEKGFQTFKRNAGWLRNLGQ